MKRVIFCGSRGWDARKRIEDRLFDIPVDAVVVHGDARGVDRIVHQEAQKAGLKIEVHPADWDRYGKRAGLIRNEEMAQLGADLCIAFWDGRSTGTLHMCEMAAKYGIPIEMQHKDFPNRPSEYRSTLFDAPEPLSEPANGGGGGVRF